nr:uncharacterized protein LOC126526342 isoform X2 [Dermacentor andersoni]
MSLVEALITDPVVLSIMSEVRKAKGVHVYLDEPDPDTLKDLKYHTPIDDLENAGIAMVRYTALVKATQDAPVFALGILDHFDDYYAVEAGINSEHKAYGCLNDGKSWQPVAIIIDYKPKKDDYIAISIKLKTPFGSNAGGKTPINQVQISLKFAEVCHLSAGGYAVIEGKYKKIDSTLSGILIGVDKSGSPEYQTFPSYNDPQQLVTILVSIGEKYCAVSSGSSHVQFNKVQPGDDFVWLVVNNIDIEKLEIHRGIKPR